MIRTNRNPRLQSTGTSWAKEIGATAIFLAFIYGTHICVSFLAAGQGS